MEERENEGEKWPQGEEDSSKDGGKLCLLVDTFERGVKARRGIVAGLQGSHQQVGVSKGPPAEDGHEEHLTGSVCIAHSA